MYQLFVRKQEIEDTEAPNQQSGICTLRQNFLAKAILHNKKKKNFHRQNYAKNVFKRISRKCIFVKEEDPAVSENPFCTKSGWLKMRSMENSTHILM